MSFELMPYMTCYVSYSRLFSLPLLVTLLLLEVAILLMMNLMLPLLMLLPLLFLLLLLLLPLLLFLPLLLLLLLLLLLFLLLLYCSCCCFYCWAMTVILGSISVNMSYSGDRWPILRNPAFHRNCCATM